MANGMSRRVPPYYLCSGLGSGMPAAMAAAMIMQTILERETHKQQAHDHDRLTHNAPIVEAVQTATQKTGSAPVRMAKP